MVSNIRMLYVNTRVNNLYDDIAVTRLFLPRLLKRNIRTRCSACLPRVVIMPLPWERRIVGKIRLLTLGGLRKCTGFKLFLFFIENIKSGRIKAQRFFQDNGTYREVTQYLFPYRFDELDILL